MLDRCVCRDCQEYRTRYYTRGSNPIIDSFNWYCDGRLTTRDDDVPERCPYRLEHRVWEGLFPNKTEAVS